MARGRPTRVRRALARRPARGTTARAPRDRGRRRRVGDARAGIVATIYAGDGMMSARPVDLPRFMSP
ncbi:MAG: hypothetical protein LC803_06395 [Acidobacteria bacterium]|nr:hypothetical protein [Acidobacteriota bacterium]